MTPYLELFYRTNPGTPGWGHPNTPGESAVLFTRAHDGTWYMPTISAAPGIYIEACDSREAIEDLTEEEWSGPLANAARSCLWTGVGLEAGRAYGRVSVRANLTCKYATEIAARPDKWILASWGQPPERLRKWFAEKVRPWAVEFPKADRGDGKPGFVRRRFWFPRTREVPDCEAYRRACVAERDEKYRQHLARKRSAQVERQPPGPLFANRRTAP